MEYISIDDVEASVAESGIDRRKLADPLSTSAIAINRYVLEPGDRFAESSTPTWIKRRYSSSSMARQRSN